MIKYNTEQLYNVVRVYKSSSIPDEVMLHRVNYALAEMHCDYEPKNSVYEDVIVEVE